MNRSTVQILLLWILSVLAGKSSLCVRLSGEVKIWYWQYLSLLGFVFLGFL